MSAPKTQRAMAQYDGNSDLLDAYNPAVFSDPNATVPVLVVPEAAVSKCKHDNETAGAFCPDCGSYRRWSDSRWQRPRVLRVGRAK